MNADGLPRVRTSLAWSRTSLSLLGNAGLLLVRDPLGRTSGVVLAGIAFTLALGTALIARRRVGALVRPVPDVTAGRAGGRAAEREIVLLGCAVGALSLAVGVAVLVTA